MIRSLYGILLSNIQLSSLDFFIIETKERQRQKPGQGRGKADSRVAEGQQERTAAPPGRQLQDASCHGHQSLSHALKRAADDLESAQSHGEYADDHQI